jgi:BASS family bile acid:Na+ symporter
VKPDLIVNLLNLIALFGLMTATGMQVKFSDLAEAAKEKRSVILGLIANYVVVLLLTIGLLLACQTDPMVSAGFLVLAVCPGAPVAPPLTELARAKVIVSVGLMLVLAASSAVLSPILLVLAYSWMYPGSILNIDYFSIVKVLLIAQLIPLIAGIAINQWAPKVSAVVAKPIGGFAKLLFIAVLVLAVIGQYRAFGQVHLRGWAAMLLLLVASLAAGWFCGSKGISGRKALALTTATRNGGVGLVIVLSNFAGTPAVAAVVVYTVVSVLGCAVLAAIWRRSALQAGGNQPQDADQVAS